MKRALSLILALTICLGLCACGNAEPKETEPAETYYNVGDTISTDLFSFTLDAATLAIALENTHGDTFGDPKEYNPQDDKDNPYVAPTGHTFAAITYTVENISRSSEEFHSGGFVSVVYKDTEYTVSEFDDCAELYYQDNEYYSNGSMHVNKANTWYSSPSNNMLVGAAEKASRKGYADFAVEADSLTDAFYLRVNIRSTEGKQTFTYQIPATN